MNCFLKPFVAEMNQLSCGGVVWTDKDGNSRVSRVFPGPCSADSVARCLIMNMSQFNGKYGCGWCEAQGEHVAVGRGTARVYPVSNLRARTNESMKRNARKAERGGKPVCGVKGPSVLYLLSYFVFPFGFVVDYMHAVCSGFVRSTACMWFMQKGSKPYHLGPGRP